jgi:hypothetical protein
MAKVYMQRRALQRSILLSLLPDLPAAAIQAGRRTTLKSHEE